MRGGLLNIYYLYDCEELPQDIQRRPHLAGVRLGIGRQPLEKDRSELDEYRTAQSGVGDFLRQ